MRRAPLLVVLLLLGLLISPETRGMGEHVEGYASAYAPGVMEGVVRLRMREGIWRVPPPRDWYTVAGYVAVMDCARVGEVTTLVDPYDNEHKVLIADCAGDDGPIDRFERLHIIVELDAKMWERLTDVHGRPLWVGLR
jgi:hypothetical protein